MKLKIKFKFSINNIIIYVKKILNWNYHIFFSSNYHLCEINIKLRLLDFLFGYVIHETHISMIATSMKYYTRQIYLKGSPLID